MRPYLLLVPRLIPLRIGERLAHGRQSTQRSGQQWASHVLDVAVRATRHAVRVLRGSPVFTLGASLSLGLGLGLTALMLSVANAYLWRPLPVPDARDLVTLAAQRPARRAPTNLSFLNYRDIADRNAVFSGLVAYAPVAAGLRVAGAADRTSGQGEHELFRRARHSARPVDSRFWSEAVQASESKGPSSGPIRPAGNPVLDMPYF